jgi:hypothetical protein
MRSAGNDYGLIHRPISIIVSGFMYDMFFGIFFIYI